MDTDQQRIFDERGERLDAYRKEVNSLREKIQELECQIEELALENGKLGQAVKCPELYKCIHGSLNKGRNE